MNTQRPEWNDANNALVGNGVSMVTLYYLRRFLDFFEGMLEGENGDVKLSAELATFFRGVVAALKANEGLIESGFDDVQRKAVLDALGEPASAYRLAIYESGFSGGFETVGAEEIRGFAALAKAYMEQRFGETQVVSVGTYTTLKLKGALKDLDRQLDNDIARANLMTTIIDDGDSTMQDLFVFWDAYS